VVNLNRFTVVSLNRFQRVYFHRFLGGGFTVFSTVFTDSITAGRTFYTAQSSNIGTASGQYTQAVYDAFNSALIAAEAKTNETFVNQDLFNYAAALAAFVPNPSTTDDVTGLSAAITTAKEYITSLGSLISTDEESYVPGTYGYTEKTALDAAIADAEKFIADGTGSPYSIDERDEHIATINAAKDDLQNSLMIYNTNKLPNGDYFIKVGGYYIDNPGDLPVTTESGVGKNQIPISAAYNTINSNLEIADAGQIISITKESTDRYSFFSALYEEGLTGISYGDGKHRNINEAAEFRSNYSGTGELAYRTQNIYYNGTAYAIQGAGSSASKGSWIFNTSNVLTYNSVVASPVTENFIFDIIPVATVFAEEVAAGRTLYNSATQGDGDGQYPEAVKSAFGTALTTAEAVTTPTKEDLFAYAAARKLFIPNRIIDSEESLSGYTEGNIIFTEGGQLIDATNLSVNGVVKVVKTFNTGAWYPIGFPFEIASISIKQGENTYVGSVYDHDNGAVVVAGNPEHVSSATTDNFYLATYDGTADNFKFAGTLPATNIGYVIAIPAGTFNVNGTNDGSISAGEVEVTFISIANPTLNSEGSISLADGYTLVANPNLINATSLSEASDYYQFNYGTPANFGRVNATLSTALKPFEAIVTYKGDTSGMLRSTLNVEHTNTATAIPVITNDAVVSTEYYNLQGVHVGTNNYLPLQSGIYIVKQIHASGKASISKSIIR
jgi:hypothetical protein